MDCRVETVMDEINGQEQIQAWNSMQCQQDQHKLHKERLFFGNIITPNTFQSNTLFICVLPNYIEKLQKKEKPGLYFNVDTMVKIT